MSARNKLLVAQPYAVERALNRVGRNLRIARLQRNQTIAEVAEKIRTRMRAVRDAETGQRKWRVKQETDSCKLTKQSD